MGKPLIDLTGQVIGNWTVISRAPNKGGHAHWLCRCQCGTEKVVVGIVLRDARSKSCGCLKNAALVARSTTHGQSRVGQRSLTYQTWASVVKRCTNPNCIDFPYYGGRGITICDRWRDFEAFFADMGEKPAGLTLDRVDNSRNYEPDNCRWATRTTQARNKRTSRYLTFDGRTQTIKEWADEVGISYMAITMRIRRGASTKEALTTK